METATGRHLIEYWDVLVRRRWIVYLGVAVVGLGALVGSFLVTPLYRASATLQIERQSPDILTFKDMAAVDYSFAAYSDFYQTQYKILSSDAVARKAAERADLLAHPSYGAARPGLLSRLKATLRSLVPSPRTDVAADPIDRAAAVVQSRLEIRPLRNSHLVQVSWVSPDAHLAARVANAVAEAYIGFNIESTYTTSDQASEFLVGQIGTLRREIDEIETRLQDYGESKRIVTVDDTANVTLRALADVASRRTEAQTVLAEKEAGWRSALDTPAEALPQVIQSDLIARLKQEHAALEAEYSEKSRSFKDDWPGLQTLKSKLDQAGRRLAEETEAIARNVRLASESEYRRARAEVANLDRLLAEQERAAQQLRRDSVAFSNLLAEVRKKRETLDALIARQSEIALATRLKDLDATSSNVRIVDKARPPEAPFRPDRTLNVLLGVILGAGLGVAFAFFLDYLDNTVNGVAEIEPLTGLPVLAAIPTLGAPARPVALARKRESAPAPAEPFDLVTHRDRRAPVSEAYRELRTAILLSSAGRPPRLVMVTSAAPEEGKSATLINLAVVLTQAGRRVLVVDTDLRRPRLHRAFGLDNARGVSTFLSGLEDAARALVRPTGVAGLDVVTSGPIPPNPSELLDAPRFAEFASDLLASGYDHVLFDSPPVLSVVDPVVVGRAAEGVVLVVRAHRTPRESVKLAVEKLAQAGVRPLGVVLNGVDYQAHGYRAYRYYGRDEHDEDRDAAGTSRAAG